MTKTAAAQARETERAFWAEVAEKRSEECARLLRWEASKARQRAFLKDLGRRLDALSARKGDGR
jgi:hypothetical protein